MEVKKSRCERLVFPRKPNYVVAGDYQASKLLTRRFPKSGESEDTIYGNVAVDLFDAQRELFYAEQRLRDKRKFQNEQRKVLDGQWAELEKKEEALKQNFVEFNQFVKENEAKRERAISQLKDQVVLRKNRDARIKEMRAEYNEMKEVKKLMDKSIYEYRIYEDYLQAVVDEYPEQFKTITDVLNWYEALLHTKQVMISRQNENLNETQQEAMQLHKLTEVYHQKIEAMQMKAAILGQRYETAKISCLKWEGILNDVKQEAMDKVSELFEVRSNCLAIYTEICQRTYVEPIYMDDCEGQLQCIKKALGQFKQLNRMARTAKEEELVVSEKPCASSRVK